MFYDRAKLRRYLGRACLLVLVSGPAASQEVPGAELRPRAVEAWERYVQLTEQRVTRELGDGRRFLVTDFLTPAEAEAVRAAVKQGEVHIWELETRDEEGEKIKVRDGMIHHWIGAIFLPGVRLRALLPWLQDYDQHHRYFREVEASKLVAREGETFRIFYRLRRKKVITVFYNSDHTVVYRQHDARRVSSRSFTTRIAQLDQPGTPAEREKPVGKDSGFLWRLNSYWRFQEEEGGVFVECESVSLSREIPFGFGWLIHGFIESIPRESLENTLNGIRDGIKQKAEADAPASAPF